MTAPKVSTCRRMAPALCWALSLGVTTFPETASLRHLTAAHRVLLRKTSLSFVALVREGPASPPGTMSLNRPHSWCRQ